MSAAYKIKLIRGRQAAGALEADAGRMFFLDFIRVRSPVLRDRQTLGSARAALEIYSATEFPAEQGRM